MKSMIRHLGMFAVILTFIGVVLSASGIAYRFWEVGWPGGGTLTGSFQIDESYSSDVLLGQSALISFQAHWSGDPNSQAYDWGINDLREPFVWDRETHQLVDMTLGANFGPVYCDPYLKVLWDYRSSSIPNWPPGDPYPYMYRIEYQAD